MKSKMKSTTYITKISVTHHLPAQTLNGKSPRCVARIFIDESRPIMEGDIAGDFVWRDTVDYSDYAEDERIRSFVANLLEVKPEDITLQFNRYTGCGMCPCSPGIAVIHKDHARNSRIAPDYSLKIENQTLN